MLARKVGNARTIFSKPSETIIVPLEISGILFSLLEVTSINTLQILRLINGDEYNNVK